MDVQNAPMLNARQIKISQKFKENLSKYVRKNTSGRRDDFENNYFIVASFLWLSLLKRVETDAQQNKANDSLREAVATITAWDGKKPISEGDAKKINRLVDLIAYSNDLAPFLPKSIDRDEQGVDTSASQMGQMEYSLAAPFTLSQFVQLLKEDVFHEGTFIQITVNNRSLGLYKNGEQYSLFDPSQKDEFTEAESISAEEVAEIIFRRYSRNAGRPLNLGLQVFSLDHSDNDFPNQPPSLEGIIESDQDFTPLEIKLGLVQAARVGSLGSVQFFLEKGAEPESKDDKGMTPLINSIKYKHKDIVELLLSKNINADVNSADNSRRTPLMYAIVANDLEVVSKLLEKGANVNAQDLNMHTPLWYAIENNNLEAVRLLINAGANVDAVALRKHTMLMFAVEKGNPDIVQLLLDNGAAVNVQDYNGFTALMFAARKGYSETIKMLLKAGARVSLKNTSEQTVLDIRQEKPLTDDVIKKLKTQANQETLLEAIRNFKGSEEEAFEIQKLLKEEGVEDKHKEEALKVALLKKQLSLVSLLIGSGAPVNCADENGQTPLMLAAGGGDEKFVKYLIGQGAAVNKKDSYGRTSLMYAAANGRLGVVEYLVDKKQDAKADPNVIDNYGYNAYGHAVKKLITTKEEKTKNKEKGGQGKEKSKEEEALEKLVEVLHKNTAYAARSFWKGIKDFSNDVGNNVLDILQGNFKKVQQRNAASLVATIVFLTVAIALAVIFFHVIWAAIAAVGAAVAAIAGIIKTFSEFKKQKQVVGGQLKTMQKNLNEEKEKKEESPSLEVPQAKEFEHPGASTQALHKTLNIDEAVVSSSPVGANKVEAEQQQPLPEVSEKTDSQTAVPK